MTENRSLPVWQTPALDALTDTDVTSDRTAPTRNGIPSSQDF